ncbi:piggyBac transposable element-derived protein 4-like [Euwallacea similis]|uniref:piggyBac transposable element-derived protein 4-like n=1 Tax=Euwallacea similis TaxID=1736056 RepID=UPI00344F427F
MCYEEEQARHLRLFETVSSGSEIEPDDDGESFTEDCVEEQEGSVSEQSLCSNSDSEESDICNKYVLRKRRIACFVAKDRTRWKKHIIKKTNIKTRACNIVYQRPGSKGFIQKEMKASSILRNFFTDSILEKIVNYTNKLISSKGDDTKKDRYNKITDLVEIKALVVLLYISEVYKFSLQNYENLFRKYGMSMEIFRLTMSAKRFSFLLCHLRFDDKSTRDERKKIVKMTAIREIFEEFTDTLPKHFNLSAYTAVDAILASFRGRCPFRVYIPSKQNRYGIKIYALVDATFYYTVKLEVYVGTYTATRTFLYRQ